MSSDKYIVIAILACATSSVLAKPSGMAFDIAKDLIVCRTKVEYDVNEERVPKTIKMLKCEDEPYEMCPAGNGKSLPCCGALPLAGAAKFSCTELQDVVMVKYASSEMMYSPMKVSIGCSCIKQSSSKAVE